MLPYVYMSKPSLANTFMLNMEALLLHKLVELTHTDIRKVLIVPVPMARPLITSAFVEEQEFIHINIIFLKQLTSGTSASD